MDDIPEKLRRNVMLISSLIICILLFNLTLKTSGSILGFIEIGNISITKLWLSLLIALAYFFLRYYFFEPVKKDIKNMSTEYLNFKIKNAYRTLSKSIRTYFKTGIQPSFLPRLLPNTINVFPLKHSSFKLRLRSLDDSCASGTISISYKIVAHNGEEYRSSAENDQYEFTLSKIQKLNILIKSIIRTAALSKATVDVFVPFALAGVAAIICTFKLLTILYFAHLPTN